MKKIFIKILIIVVCVLLLFTGIISSKIFINKNFIKNYPSTFNQEYRLVLLSVFNVYEPYIAHYNYGNYYYKEGRYEEAVEKYKKALTYNIPRRRICDVEINLSLSLMQIASTSESSEAVELLKEAKNHLNVCANMNLDDVIEEERIQMQEELAKKQKEGESSDSGSGDPITGKVDLPAKETTGMLDNGEKNNSGEGDGQDEHPGSDKNKPGDAKEGIPGTKGKPTDTEGDDPSSDGTGGNGDGNGGTGGTGEGTGDGGGGTGNENNAGQNNGTGNAGDGNGVGSGNSNINGESDNAGRSDGSTGTVDGGANGSGTVERGQTGTTGNGTGTVGSSNGKTTAQKQKEASNMVSDINQELNSLLQKMNEEEELKQKAENIKLNDKVNELRESNQSAMQISEISMQQISKQIAQAAAKSTSGSSITGRGTPGENVDGNNNSDDVAGEMNTNAGTHGTNSGDSSYTPPKKTYGLQVRQ